MGLKGRYCVVALVLAVYLLSSSTTATKGKCGCDERKQEEERDNPYVFGDEDFETVLQNQYGRERMLPKFTEFSRLLKGIEKFRVEIFELKPLGFIIPQHLDADILFFIANGRGTVTYVNQDKRESFNVQRGDIMTYPAGSQVYVANRDDNQRLIFAKVIQPIAINTGEGASFFGTGGRGPQSYFNAFEPEILEALFNVPREELETLFKKQEEGLVRGASKEQIRALSKDGEEGHWPFGGGARSSNGPFNVFKQRPLYNNEFGKLIEVDSDDFRQLRDLNWRFSYTNITQGGMHTMHYNTRATKIAVVVSGKGRFQMACPHISGEKSLGHFEKVSGDLKCGTVFVVPAGHPFVTIASKDENLEVICFEVNAEDNEKVVLAGKNSVFKQFERVTKELSFNEKAEVVEEFLEKQDRGFFFEGPRTRHGRRGSRSDE